MQELDLIETVCVFSAFSLSSYFAGGIQSIKFSVGAELALKLLFVRLLIILMRFNAYSQTILLEK